MCWLWLHGTWLLVHSSSLRLLMHATMLLTWLLLQTTMMLLLMLLLSTIVWLLGTSLCLLLHAMS